MNRMKKTAAVLCFLPLVLAAGLKIDIDGRDDGLNIKAVKCSPKMSWQHPAWAKSPGYMIFTRAGRFELPHPCRRRKCRKILPIWGSRRG